MTPDTKTEKLKLFQHQVTGIEFLKQKGRAILADAMGLGKTIQAIMAAKDNDGNAVVVCPASVKINWAREIRGLRPKDDIRVISGRKGAENAILRATEGDKTWFIINYDVLEAWKDKIVGEKSINTLILDESHYIKGKTIRAKATTDVAKKIKNVYCLTGTPLMNRPIELFNQLRAIGHPLGSNRTVFAKRYCGAFYMQQMINNYDGRKIILPQSSAYNLNRQSWRFGFKFLNESGATNLDELREKIKDCMLRRTKEQVLDLPPKIIQTMETELDDQQRWEYDGAWDLYIERIKSETDAEKLNNIIAAREIVELTKLKQVCSQSKIKRIAEDVENAVDQGEKVIIFTQYSETIVKVVSELTGRKIKSVILDGTRNQNQRQEAIDQFEKDPDTKAFVANIKAGGTGINLTTATIVIFADMEWSPGLHDQAEDRAHRIGQTGTVNVYYYVCKDTIEEDIIELLAKKKQVVSEVMDGTKKRIQTNNIMAEFNRKMSERSAVHNSI